MSTWISQAPVINTSLRNASDGMHDKETFWNQIATLEYLLDEIHI